MAFSLFAQIDFGRKEIWIRRATRRARRRRLLPKRNTPLFSQTFVGEYGDRDPDWSPDGQSIVFSRTELIADDRLSEPTIYIYHRGRVRPLTKGSDPTWSTHGEIAFVRDVGARFIEFALFVIRPDGTGERRVPNTEEGTEPDWSPRGYRLAFVQSDRHIATVFANGEGLRRVTRRSECRDSSPAFSPGGGQLAFAREGDRCPGMGSTFFVDEPGLVSAVRSDGQHLRNLAGGDVVGNLDWQARR